MVRVTDMTHGRPIRLILLFSLPLMLGSVFQQLYTIVDTIIIGRGVGMQALASIGAADWINWLVLWGLQGFTQGFAILAAQEFGASAYDRLRRVLAMIVKLSCWFGIAVTIISLLLVRPLLTLLHTDPAVFGGAQTYLYVQFGGSLIIIAYNMAAAVLRCLGDSRTPLFAIIAASFANIALDLLFVMGFGWGIFGASFATVLAQLIAFLLCLRSLRRLPFVQLTKADWKTDPAILLHLCRLGIPTGLQMSMITLGGMVLQSVLNGFGVVFVAGYTAANKLYGILESASVAFGYAMTAYMGQNRGARNAARIDAGIRAVLVLSAEFTAAIVTAMLRCGQTAAGTVSFDRGGGRGRCAGGGLSVSHGADGVFVCTVHAAGVPLLTAGAGRDDCADAFWLCGNAHAHGRGARAADLHRAERRILCGRRSMGVRGSAQSGMVLYADWENQAGYAAIAKRQRELSFCLQSCLSVCSSKHKKVKKSLK